MLQKVGCRYGFNSNWEAKVGGDGVFALSCEEGED